MVVDTIKSLALRKVKEDGKSGRMEISFDEAPKGLYFPQLVWGMALVHYIFWGVFVGIAAYLLSGIWFVRATAILCFVAYQPSFWDGSEKRLGRPWDWLREHPIWQGVPPGRGRTQIAPDSLRPQPLPLPQIQSMLSLLPPPLPQPPPWPWLQPLPWPWLRPFVPHLLQSARLPLRNILTQWQPSQQQCQLPRMISSYHRQLVALDLLLRFFLPMAT